MNWRPRTLLAPLVVVVLLAAGTSATGAPPATDVAGVAAADAEECGTVPISAVGEPASPSSEGGGSVRSQCWTITPVSDGAHTVRLSSSDIFFRAGLTVTAPDGEVLVDTRPGAGRGLSTAALRAGIAYRVEVTRDSQSAVLDPYRVVVHDLSSGCADLPVPRWGGDGLAMDISDDRLGCGEITLTEASPLRLEVTGAYGGPVIAVVDDLGAEQCRDRLATESAWPTALCRSLPPGTYRVAVAPSRALDAPVELSAVPVTTTDAGCRVMEAGGYGKPLPVSGTRAQDGTGQECFSVVADSTGPHDLRGWQHEDPERWRAAYEVWDVESGEMVQQTSDYADFAHQARVQPTRVDLVAGRTYRVLVSGLPYAESHTRIPYDGRYRLGLVDRRSTDGCDPAAPTGWRDPATTGDVDGGAMTCRLLDLPEGSWVRVDFRGLSSRPHQVQSRLLDAEGRLVRTQEGGICRFDGLVVETPHADPCLLVGEGPYRFVTHTDLGADRAEYSVRATSLTDSTGCRTLPWATWGEPLPASRTLDATGTDCWLVDLPRASVHTLSMAEDGSPWPQNGLEAFHVDDGRPARLWDEVEAGTYRLVVAGDPGGTTGGYRFGVFDRAGRASDGEDLDVSCPVLASTSIAAEPATGVTTRGGYDCYRVPAGVHGPLLARLGPMTGDAPRAHAEVRGGPNGWTECGTSSGAEYRCELGRGSYRVLVSGGYPGPRATPYAFSLSDPTNRAGCLPARAAGPDAEVVVADLPAGGASSCVALDDVHDRLLWSVDAADDVRAVVLDGEGEAACQYWPNDDGLDLCLLRHEDGASPAPFTVVLTNTGTQDRRARMLLRSDPSAERGCAPASWSDGNGPMPLLGRTDGGLDAECHSLDMADGGVLLNRTNLDGAEPPDVLVYDPTGRPICGEWGDDEAERTPECYTRGADGRYVFWVLGDEDSVGRYRIDLGCDNLRIGCAQAPPVDFTRTTMRGRVAVGRTLRAGVRGVPPRGQVSWRWYVADRVVRRTRAYTPSRADAGKRLRVQAVVTAPRYPRRTIRTPARTVRTR